MKPLGDTLLDRPARVSTPVFVVEEHGPHGGPSRRLPGARRWRDGAAPGLAPDQRARRFHRLGRIVRRSCARASGLDAAAHRRARGSSVMEARAIADEFSLSIVIACYRDAGSIHEFYRRLNEVLPALTSRYEIIYVNDAVTGQRARDPDDAGRRRPAPGRRQPHAKFRQPERVPVRHAGVARRRGDPDGRRSAGPAAPHPAARRKVARGLRHRLRRARQAPGERCSGSVAYKAFYRLFRRLADFTRAGGRWRFRPDGPEGGHGRCSKSFPSGSCCCAACARTPGFEHTGVEYVRDARWDGRSTNSLSGNIRWAKLAIFSFSYKPLSTSPCWRWLRSWRHADRRGLLHRGVFSAGRSAPSGFMTLLLITLFLGSVQLVCFAIVAEYLRHMYEELKRRPRYMVRDVIDRRDDRSRVGRHEPRRTSPVRQRIDSTGAISTRAAIDSARCAPTAGSAT